MANFEKKIQLSHNLKHLIDRENLSLSQLSRRTSINKSTLHNYLNGVLPQGLLALIKISLFFKIPLEELIFRKEETLVTKISAYEGRYEITIKKINE